MQYSSQILFFIVFGIILYYGFNSTEHSETNYKRGLQAACFVLVAQGTLKTYDAPFVRPHGAFWRAISRYVLIYLVCLVFLIFQNVDDGRQLFKYLYPELGKPVIKGMHTYDDHCEFEFENIWDNIDHYYAIHVINWFCSALILRDAWFLHFWSILDELIELSWQHVLPHFRECWWDHILLDVLLSNTPAIIFGLWVAKKLNLKEYDWLGRKGRSFTNWLLWRDHRRFGVIFQLLIVITVNFLTGFFIINGLWIPPKNWINIYRLSVWFLLGGLAFGEGYNDIENWGTPERANTPISAQHRWVAFGVLLVETLICWKYRHGSGNLIDAPWPNYITIPWLSAIGLFTLFYLYLRFKPGHTTKFTGNENLNLVKTPGNASPNKKKQH